MGYGISTTAIYGVHLNSNESIKLYEALERHAKSMVISSELIDEIGYDPNNGEISYAMFFLYAEQPNQLVNNPFAIMIAEDTDSRIHNNNYDEGYEHVFGVYLSDMGYGSRVSNKDFMSTINAGPTQEQRDYYESVCRGILLDAGISTEPDVVIASYTA